MNGLSSLAKRQILLAPVVAAFLALPVLGDDAPTKRRIERSTKEVVAGASTSTAMPLDNPKVAPGRVAWHPTFAAACEAARKSGRPVLLFQMMGKLDDQFC